MTIRIGVIGAGSWGTTVASLTTTNADTLLWALEPEVAVDINENHCNGMYLPGFELPEGLRATSDLDEVAAFADVVVMGVPSEYYRNVLESAAPPCGRGFPSSASPRASSATR